MSLQFNKTSSPYNGIIQRLEIAIYGENGLGRISGDATLLALWTTRINLALDKVFAIIFQADGYWQFDDGNHSDYPTITTNLVANQRDYPFTTDENGNLILDVHAVYAKQSSTSTYELLEPIDEIRDIHFYDEANVTGAPLAYGKRANAIFLDPIPDTNITDGLKIEISREGSYFTTSDTTKKPGFAGLFHDYLVVQPAFEYGLENNLATTQGYQLRAQELEKAITKYYSKRAQDERPIITMKKINYI